MYNSVSGHLVGAEVKKSDFGDQLYIYIKDGETFCVQCSVESAYFRSFVNKLAAVNLEEQIELSPYSFEAEGKKKQGYSIKQGGEKVPYADIGGPSYPESGTEKEVKVYFLDRQEYEVEYLSKFQFPKTVTPEEVAKKLGEVDFDASGEDAPF